MSWKVRHEGSPKAVGPLTLQQLVDGLLDGMWDPTDEVMGPNDTTWVPIESHPQLEEIASEIEPPPPKTDSDESRLDMTPLIDVCLVLLIFMILTISYGAIQMQLEAANLATDKPTGPIVVSPEKVAQTMIVAEARLNEKRETIIMLEDKEVPEGELEPALKAFVRDTGKVELLIKPGLGVRRKAIVAIHDAARGAGISKIHLLAAKELLAP